MIRKIKLVPIVLLSLACVSATVVGVNEYINNVEQQNAVKNPVLMLDANDPTGEATFSTGDTKISKVVRYGTLWGTYKNNMPIPTKPGYDITGWQYSFDGVNFSDVYDSLSFTSNTYLRVKAWGATTKDTFATDSWATIVNIAQNGGLAALKNAYYADISRFGGTFVIQDFNNEEEVAAKTRTVYLKGLGEYKVHVIGEDEDKVAGAENKVASLTFEFDNVVIPTIGFSKGDGSNSWENSYLRYFLKTLFINRLPEPINDPDVLQTVEKRTFNQEKSSPVDPIYDITEETVFIPSLSELGYSNMLEDPYIREIDYPDFTNAKGDHNIPCLDEGNPYSFYQYGNNNQARLKTYIDGENEIPMSYWTRSPFTRDVNTQIGEDIAYRGIHAIDENGLMPGMYYKSHEEGSSETAPIRALDSVNGVSPCFCIGQDDAYKLTVTVADGSNIIAKHTDYISNNLDARVQLIDTRDYSSPVIHYNTGLLDTETYKEIHVKVDGQTIPTADLQYTNYTYDRKTGVLNIKIDENYKKITSGVEVVIDKPAVTKFETDSWETFFTNAEQGYDKLANIYDNAYAANGDTFLGLKREIKLKDTSYGTAVESTVLARVIGEKHDITTDNKTTALTFQFTQGYKIDEVKFTPQGEPYVVRHEFYDDSGYFAEFGYLGQKDSFVETGVDPRGLANFVDNDRVKSEGGLINETNFAKFIKTVKKDVVECKDSKGRSLSHDAQLFLPSYEELTGDTSFSFEDSDHNIMHEGVQYEYYTNANDYAHRFDSGSLYFYNYGMGGACCSNTYCWTRSVSKESVKGRGYYKGIAINGQTGLARALTFDDFSCAIIPCFAVGIA